MFFVLLFFLSNVLYFLFATAMQVAFTPGQIYALTLDSAKIRPEIDCMFENMPPTRLIKSFTLNFMSF